MQASKTSASNNIPLISHVIEILSTQIHPINRSVLPQTSRQLKNLVSFYNKHQSQYGPKLKIIQNTLPRNHLDIIRREKIITIMQKCSEGRNTYHYY